MDKKVKIRCNQVRDELNQTIKTLLATNTKGNHKKSNATAKSRS